MLLPPKTQTHKIQLDVLEKKEVNNKVRQWIDEHGKPSAILASMEIIKWIKLADVSIKYGSGLQYNEIIFIE